MFVFGEFLSSISLILFDCLVGEGVAFFGDFLFFIGAIIDVIGCDIEIRQYAGIELEDEYPEGYLRVSWLWMISAIAWFVDRHMPRTAQDHSSKLGAGEEGSLDIVIIDAL